MISIDKIKNISFRKANIGGYKTEDVDKFIDEVIEYYGGLMKEKDELMNRLNESNDIVLSYKNREKNIGAALMNAQQQADAIIREAKHKSEIIIGDATKEGEKIILNAKDDVSNKRNEVANIQREISSFKDKLLSIYSQHMQFIDALPTFEEEKVEEQEKMPENSDDVETTTITTESEPISVIEEISSVDSNKTIDTQSQEENSKDSGFNVNLAIDDEYFPPEWSAKNKLADLDFDDDNDDTPIGFFRKRN